MSGGGFGGLGRVLIVVGLGLVVLGLFLGLGGKIGLGHLPGDIVIRRGNVTFYFPLASMLLVSFVASLILGLIARR